MVEVQPHKTKPIIYFTQYCPDCIRALAQFKFNKIEIKKVNIVEKPEAREIVRQINNGNESVPTIIFPNGDILVEPSYLELSKYINSILVDEL